MRESSANPCSITSAGFCSSRTEFIAPAYSVPGPQRRLFPLEQLPLIEPKPVVARMRMGVVLALASLYTAQGVPFGFATEYLPVVLREQGVSYAGIAALSWLQLPWQLKVFWAK